ncbi:hypothetical protein ACJX0J_026988, partial [Zea mays]
IVLFVVIWFGLNYRDYCCEGLPHVNFIALEIVFKNYSLCDIFRSMLLQTSIYFWTEECTCLLVKRARDQITTKYLSGIRNKERYKPLQHFLLDLEYLLAA